MSKCLPKISTNFRYFIILIGLLHTLPSHAQLVSTVDSSRVNTFKSEKDSLLYSKIKSRLSKNKIMSQIYDALFRDIYNKNANNQQVNQIEENPFKNFEGKVIRKIYIKRLKVFGETIYDTTKKARGLDDVLNRLHKDTRENVIRKSFLMFDVGDIINPDRLRDNERLMRQSSILHDARILVIPDEQFPNLVDLLVITQDVWSLLPDMEFGGFGRFAVGINQVNFQGLGHSWKNTVYYNNGQDKKFEYATRYTVPYIGRSFVTGQLDLIFRRELMQNSIRFFRPFLTPDMKIAGGFEFSRYAYTKWQTLDANGRVLKINDTTVFTFPITYNYTDLWLAHAFKLSFLDKENQKRSRLVLSMRYSNYVYTERPYVTKDTNQLYRNHQDILFGMGFSSRRYKRDILIYGLGRTEDVPYGYLASFVAGWENSQLWRRFYSGIKLAKGEYFNGGYFYGLINAGGYTDGTSVFSLETNYFSHLHKVGKSQIRHFVTLRYAAGNNRYTGEFIDLNDNNGISSISSDRLRGIKRLVLSYQAVIFSRVSFVGFRVAPFFFADLGMVNIKEKALLSSPVYSGFGIGFRFRNENLTFNTFQIRLGLYPNIPDVSTFNFTFGDVPTLRLKDFDISAPEIVPFK